MSHFKRQHPSRSPPREPQILYTVGAQYIKDYDSDIILAFYCEGLLALYPPHSPLLLQRTLTAIRSSPSARNSFHSERSTAHVYCLGDGIPFTSINRHSELSYLRVHITVLRTNINSVMHMHSFVSVLLLLLSVHSNTSTHN